MTTSGNVDQLAHDLVRKLIESGRTFSTAESLTGGLISAAITSVPGSSEIFYGGIVAYSVAVKVNLLGVSQDDISHGVVSEQVAGAMARGAMKASGSDLAVSCTGVAGPGPQDGIAPGTVWVACASNSQLNTQFLQLTGDREQVRTQTLAASLALALNMV
jgi:PncC family amidohydrolase